MRFARSGDARIAFRVMGERPLDVVAIGGPASHLDIMLEDPEVVRVQQRFVSFARLLGFDRRGTGLSDPVDRPLTLEQQMDDLEAVLEAAGRIVWRCTRRWSRGFARCMRPLTRTG